MKRNAALALIFGLSMSGCASMRGMKVESDNSATYSIDVRNNRSSTVTVSYSDDDNRTRDLGEVRPGRTERFVVVSTDGRITVYAQSSTGANLAPQSVSLSTGTTAITIR